MYNVLTGALLAVALLPLGTLAQEPAADDESAAAMNPALTPAEPADPTEAATLPSQYSCSQGETVRRVEVTYHQPGQAVPCSVIYYKHTASEQVAPKTLWNAEYEANFCEERAAEFVEKLENWGWNCAAE